MQILRYIFPCKKPEPWEQRKLNKELSTAVAAGDVKAARKLIRSGAEVDNRPDIGKPSYLYDMAEKGNAEMIRFLVKAGMDVNHADIFAHMATPLQVAVDKGQCKAVETLLELGAEPDKSDVLNPPALYRAVMRNSKKMAVLLLKHGADINGRTFKGLTPLHLAVNTRNAAMVEFLLERGADITIADRRGVKPMDLDKCQTSPDVRTLIQAHISGQHATRLKSLRRRAQGTRRSGLRR